MKKYIILFLLWGVFGNAQYNLFARQNFAKSGTVAGFNTEIGGVASTISTPALLASKLAIDVSRISNFAIVGSDIKCKITGSYTSVNFNGDTSITYFDDKDGLITDLMSFAFENTPNLKRLSLKGIINLSGSHIVRYDQFTSRTIEVYLDNCVTMGLGFDQALALAKKWQDLAREKLK